VLLLMAIVPQWLKCDVMMKLCSLYCNYILFLNQISVHKSIYISSQH